ncbi:hypothetical protein NDU88_002249 [Pleurodeles waltl]|uniref:Uncharacterized protein n=1 Tax=Pleurodeles waltl TaxID=8319 RepID=A0AAV7TK78_PLEWA|nr:hypothetical protein NDU88_002249 [Pleurodeles waltl]
MKCDSYIKASVGELTPPENSPAYIVMEERGVALCFWLKQCCKLSKKRGSLAFPEHGTFNLRILDQLQMALYEIKTLPRPAQLEALAVWELVARQQQEMKYKRRIKRVEKSLAEAKWDWEQKRWRAETLQCAKLFPANTEEEAEEDGAKEVESAGKKKKRKSYVDDEDYDVEDLIMQLLRDRPPPLMTYSGGPGTSATTTAPAQAQGAEGAVQAEGGQIPGVVQSTPNAGTTTVVQAQMHPPTVQTIYPDVPVLEAVSNIMVPRE